MEDETRELLLIEKGNQLAFDGFMTRHAQRLYVHAYGILGSKELAEEVVSDVFLEVWNKRKELLEIENMNKWLNTIVYHKSISSLRKEMKQRKNVPIEEMVNFRFPQMSTPVDNMITQEEQGKLKQAIDALPPKCKHVFFLAKIEQLPYADIADMLEISLPTVNYHIAAAMGNLKKALAK